MKKIYYSWSQIEGACLEIARQISLDNWKPDYIVGVTRGGAIPSVMLSQFLEIPMRPLEVSLRDGGQCVSDLGMAEDAYAGKKILIVDDINDQGSTINWIKNDWESGCFSNDPKWKEIWGENVRIAVLTHNFGSKFEDPNYFAWTVDKREEDCWLVYPWEEFWR